MTYQPLDSPEAVVACASMRTRSLSGVSAFHEATRRVKLKPGWVVGDSHVPLAWPAASMRWSPSSTTPSKVPALNALAEAKRANAIGVAAPASAAPLWAADRDMHNPSTTSNWTISARRGCIRWQSLRKRQRYRCTASVARLTRQRTLSAMPAEVSLPNTEQIAALKSLRQIRQLVAEPLPADALQDILD